MPYKGSKSKIAEQILNVLPDSEWFVDLFGGGGAISHCAALSMKYHYVLYNEIEPLIYKAFKMAINGDFKKRIKVDKS
jgi:site-specific DNA-adenine methylase